MVSLAYDMFLYIVLHRQKWEYLPHPLYEVPAIRVNTNKSTYTFTSVHIAYVAFKGLFVQMLKTVVQTCIMGFTAGGDSTYWAIYTDNK